MSGGSIKRCFGAVCGDSHVRSPRRQGQASTNVEVGRQLGHEESTWVEWAVNLLERHAVGLGQSPPSNCVHSNLTSRRPLKERVRDQPVAGGEIALVQRQGDRRAGLRRPGSFSLDC
jgi:hypothetical protein